MVKTVNAKAQMGQLVHLLQKMNSQTQKKPQGQKFNKPQMQKVFKPQVQKLTKPQGKVFVPQTLGGTQKKLGGMQQRGKVFIPQKLGGIQQRFVQQRFGGIQQKKGGIQQKFGGKVQVQAGKLALLAGKPAQSKFMEKLATIDASKKVWVGDLSPNTTWKELEKHIQEVTGTKPSITEIMPKGKQACLAFKTEDAASTAIAMANESLLQGKQIQVDVWTQKEKKEGARPDKKQQRKPNTALLKVAKTAFAKRSLVDVKGAAKKQVRGDLKIKEKLASVDIELKVWVGGLAKEITHNQLRKCFAEAGCKPNLVNLTGKTNACVSFKTADEAASAIAALNGADLEGSTLEVDVWTQAEKKEKK